MLRPSHCFGNREKDSQTAEILSNGQKVSVTTANPIDSGLGSYVETLLRKSSSEFNVRSHFPDQSTKSSITLDSRIQYWKDEDQALQRMDHKVQRKLFNINAGDHFSSLLQLCGTRGDANAPAKSLFWQPRKGLSYVLTFESHKERNAAIMIARKHALDCSVMLGGPDDEM
ncbi:hypothetical protein V6N12_057507 [Hibiscus sabdariffa]|uniref:Stomatal closure-related actin-binding protein PH domain-containing protein n=1 Tax=Hibiscus sabdariffa TaxID=183260 RepID=A0ABR2C5B3_9ROSI